MVKILIVDDNHSHRVITRLYLEQYDFRVIEASNARTGIELVINEKPDCVLLDHRMIGDSGLVMLHEMQKDIQDPPPVIFLSALADESLKRNVMALGAFAYLEKSAATAELLNQVIREAIDIEAKQEAQSTTS